MDDGLEYAPIHMAIRQSIHDFWHMTLILVKHTVALRGRYLMVILELLNDIGNPVFVRVTEKSQRPAELPQSKDILAQTAHFIRYLSLNCGGS